MFPVKFSQLNCELFIKIHRAVVRIGHHSLCSQNQRTMVTYETCMTFAAPSSITVEMKKLEHAGSDPLFHQFAADTL